jgi:hypothetical protein
VAGKYYKHNAEDGDTCDWTGVVHTPGHYLDADPFVPAPRVKAPAEAYPMSPLGEKLAAGLKELFYNYVNRKQPDNRSAQLTIGPSEVGTPCDRRLAMSLMRTLPVNPGGDGWAAFVGTCVHVGLADMFVWAGKHTGRYAVEVPLTFGSEYMPKGTGDLLDRTLYLFADHKLMGRSSLDRLRTAGPSETYVVQVMLYAYAARRAGETVENVAIYGWPREGSSLSDLYVWAVPYDPAVAANALARVERIGGLVAAHSDMKDWDTADDCRFCPHHGPSSCPGR